MIQNRIEKNLKRLTQFLSKLGIEAYRLYDRDIPEFPFIIDVYRDYAVIYDRREEIDLTRPERADYLNITIRAVATTLRISAEHIILKERKRQKGTSQYEKLSARNEFLVVNEGPAKLRVNLFDFLDTGLFLDHRIMRERVYRESKDKKILNLFCYTGSVSVFAALGGGRVTSVDMSNTYIEWAKQNFLINGIDLKLHTFIVQDALEYLEYAEPGPKFDLIFLDPPTFSNSKRMQGDFEVERDQDLLVKSCLRLLSPDGVLYFSNNKRNFRLNPELTKIANIKNITEKTIPFDFHDKKIHHVFEIRPMLLA